VHLESVSKKFCRNLKRGMLYTTLDVARELCGLPIDSAALRPGEFWGLENVSLELQRGECVGIVGANGAGKSTLLKLLNGILLPDRGRIEVTGRVGALIEVGAGFHPMLTGRENIYVNGAILGMRTREIDRKFDAIVEFSGLAPDILDAPVKSYSSGMYVRLGFAVAVHTDPDVLLVDEVLSVGDIRFVGRCREKIAELQRNGVSIVLVSHSLTLIEETCERGVLLVGGKVAASGTAKAAVNAYRKSGSSHSAQKHSLPVTAPVVRFLAADILSEDGRPIASVPCGDTILLDLLLATQGTIDFGRFCLWMIHEQDDQITGVGYQRVGQDVPPFQSGTIRFAIRCQMLPGDYRLGVTFSITNEYDLVDEFAPCQFTVVPRADTFTGNSGVYQLDLRTIQTVSASPSSAKR
jgi:lipopolysaccharide transport system ATP-binding protein